MSIFEEEGFGTRHPTFTTTPKKNSPIYTLLISHLYRQFYLCLIIGTTDYSKGITDETKGVTIATT